jgi:hypothetical protein
MKINPESSFKSALQRLFRPRSRKHDPLLLLNMSHFNFTDGWRRTFFDSEYARFSA